MPIRSILATAASILLASTVLAVAQGVQKQGPGAEGGPAPGQVQQEGQGKQAPQKSDRRENGKQQGAAQNEQREGPKQQQGKQQKEQQNQKEQRAEPKGKADEHNAAQRGERNDAQKGERTEGQRGERNDGQRGERTEGRGDKTLTVEQKTKVRETVLRGGDAPRMTNVNFRISVGTVVPTTVRVVEVPTVLIEYYPEWRGYFYFIVNDEIIIVDRNHHIVAVLEV
jgi:hypothetical protein